MSISISLYEKNYINTFIQLVNTSSINSTELILIINEDYLLLYSISNIANTILNIYFNIDMLNIYDEYKYRKFRINSYELSKILNKIKTEKLLLLLNNKLEITSYKKNKISKNIIEIEPVNEDINKAILIPYKFSIINIFTIDMNKLLDIINKISFINTIVKFSIHNEELILESNNLDISQQSIIKIIPIYSTTHIQRLEYDINALLILSKITGIKTKIYLYINGLLKIKLYINNVAILTMYLNNIR